jgi:hypothetical protein
MWFDLVEINFEFLVTVVEKVAEKQRNLSIYK